MAGISYNTNYTVCVAPAEGLCSRCEYAYAFTLLRLLMCRLMIMRMKMGGRGENELMAMTNK